MDAFFLGENYLFDLDYLIVTFNFTLVCVSIVAQVLVSITIITHHRSAVEQANTSFLQLQRSLAKADSCRSSTIMEKIVGTPNAIIEYNYPYVTTEFENGAWHFSIESRGSRFYHNPSPPYQSILGIRQGFWQHDSNQHCVGGKGIYFSKIKQCVNLFLTILACHSDPVADIECILGTEFVAFQVFSFHALVHGVHTPFRVPQQAGEAKNVAQEFKLSSSGSLNKWCCFYQVISGNISYSVNPLNVQHFSLT